MTDKTKERKNEWKIKKVGNLKHGIIKTNTKRTQFYFHFTSSTLICMST